VTDSTRNLGQTIKTFIEEIIFNVRWMLIPFYLGLIFVLFLYAFAFAKQVLGMFSMQSITTESMMLVVLGAVDVVMIANLVKMIISGSYNSFVSKTHGYQNENASSGMLKVKMSMSIIGVSSIHLLQSFVEAPHISTEVITKQLIIHGTFIVGTLCMAVIEYLHIKGDAIEHEMEHGSGHDATKTTHTTDHK
jgi:uncharacterized protein (TIGR00645 family)